MLRVTLAGLHLIALGLGLLSVVYRGSALREVASLSSLQRAFKFDTLWGIAAGLWIATGLWRLLAEVEKPVSYYAANTFFHAKMGALILILVLEIWPMVTLIRWRIALRKGATPQAVAVPQLAKRIAVLGHVQATLLVVMIFAAAGMARGFGAH